MRIKRMLLIFGVSLFLVTISGCSAESPFSVQGKPKLAGERCGPEVCKDRIP